jgi:hypothetical protein
VYGDQVVLRHRLGTGTVSVPLPVEVTTGEIYAQRSHGSMDMPDGYGGAEPEATADRRSGRRGRRRRRRRLAVPAGDQGASRRIRPFIPDAEEGQVLLETVRSKPMGVDLNLLTAVPAGHWGGKGLPVVVILHGASASVAEFQEYGLGRFLTAAVEAGAPPFVLAGTDDGARGWVPDGDGADPQRMLLDELPPWLA